MILFALALLQAAASETPPQPDIVVNAAVG